MSIKKLLLFKLLILLSLNVVLAQYEIRTINPVTGNDGSIRIWLGNSTNPDWAGPFDISVSKTPNLLFPFFEVDNSTLNEYIPNLTSGEYHISITDRFGCVTNFLVELVDFECPLISFNLTQIDHNLDANASIPTGKLRLNIILPSGNGLFFSDFQLQLLNTDTGNIIESRRLDRSTNVFKNLSKGNYKILLTFIADPECQIESKNYRIINCMSETVVPCEDEPFSFCIENIFDSLEGDIEILELSNPSSDNSADGFLTYSIFPLNADVVVNWSYTNLNGEAQMLEPNRNFLHFELQSLEPGELCYTVDNGCSNSRNCLDLRACDTGSNSIEIIPNFSTSGNCEEFIDRYMFQFELNGISSATSIYNFSLQGPVNRNYDQTSQSDPYIIEGLSRGSYVLHISDACNNESTLNFDIPYSENSPICRSFNYNPGGIDNTNNGSNFSNGLITFQLDCACGSGCGLFDEPDVRIDVNNYSNWSRYNYCNVQVLWWDGNITEFNLLPNGFYSTQGGLKKTISNDFDSFPITISINNGECVETITPFFSTNFLRYLNIDDSGPNLIYKGTYECNTCVSSSQLTYTTDDCSNFPTSSGFFLEPFDLSNACSSGGILRTQFNNGEYYENSSPAVTIESNAGGVSDGVFRLYDDIFSSLSGAMPHKNCPFGEYGICLIPSSSVPGLPPRADAVVRVLYCLDPQCPSIGTPCNDRNPNTIMDAEDGNCNCIGVTEDECPPRGSSCDDGNSATINDIEDGDCNCIGHLENECPQAGMPCDDNDMSTVLDEEDGNCNCIGQDCGATIVVAEDNTCYSARFCENTGVQIGEPYLSGLIISHETLGDGFCKELLICNVTCEVKDSTEVVVCLDSAIGFQCDI